ncbi:MAG: hypothetical protein R3Y07_06070 [Eubacteriales bacterium]
MTTQDHVKKWLIYSFVFLPIWMIDCYVLGRYPIYGATPLLFVLAVMAVATLEGQFPGGWYGLGVGLVWEATYTGGAGVMVVILALGGAVCGALMQYVLKRGIVLYLLGSAITLAGIEVMWMLHAVFHGAPANHQLIFYAGAQIILTMCYAPIVYGMYGWVYYRRNRRKIQPSKR